MLRKLLPLLFAFMVSQACHAVTLDMDSIRERGSFARFCVDVYRWGDRTFNSYDTTYVAGTGKNFTIRPSFEGWSDYYRLGTNEDNGYALEFNSYPYMTVGARLQFMALSGGYNKSVGRAHGESRSRLQLGFNCNMLEVNFSRMINDGGTRLRSVIDDGNKVWIHRDVPRFHSRINTIEAVYYFNHHRYSQAAAMSMSKLQLRSAGSAFAGIRYESHLFSFDLNSMSGIYEGDEDYDEDGRMEIRYHSYMAEGGYGYNLVLPHGWIIGSTLAASTGWAHITFEGESFNRYSLGGAARVGVGWNCRNVFLSALATGQGNFFFDQGTVMLSAIYTFSVSVGYRFNLW